MSPYNFPEFTKYLPGLSQEDFPYIHINFYGTVGDIMDSLPQEELLVFHLGGDYGPVEIGDTTENSNDMILKSARVETYDGTGAAEYDPSPASELDGNLRTIGVLFKVSSIPSASETLISRGTGAGEAGYALLIEGTTGEVTVLTRQSSASTHYVIRGSDEVIVDSWNEAEVDFDTAGAVTAIRLNGVTQTLVTVVPPAGSYSDESTDLRLGVRGDGTNAFTGDIGDAWIKDGGDNTLWRKGIPPISSGSLTGLPALDEGEGITVSEDRTAAVFDGSLYFRSDANTGYIIGANTGELRGRFRHDDVPLTYWSAIFTVAQTSTNSRYFFVALNTSGQLAVVFQNFSGSTYRVLHTSDSYTDNLWHDFRVWSDGTTVRAEIDGVQESLTVEEGSNDGFWMGDVGSLQSTSIGARRTSAVTGEWQGNIDWIEVDNSSGFYRWDSNNPNTTTEGTIVEKGFFTENGPVVYESIEPIVTEYPPVHGVYSGGVSVTENNYGIPEELAGLGELSDKVYLDGSLIKREDVPMPESGTPFSISLKYKTKEFPNDCRLVSFGNNGQNATILGIGVVADGSGQGKLKVFFRDDSNVALLDELYDTLPRLDDGEEHDISWEYDGGAGHTFTIDGSSIVGNADISNVTSEVLAVGGLHRIGPSNFCQGVIWDFAYDVDGGNEATWDGTILDVSNGWTLEVNPLATVATLRQSPRQMGIMDYNVGYWLDGSQTIDASSSLIPATDDFDLSVEFIADGLDGTYRTLVGQFTSGAEGRFVLQARSGNVNLFIGGTGSININGSTALNDGEVYTIRLTRASNLFTLYLNGVSEGTASSSISILQVNTIFGGNTSVSPEWQGLLFNAISNGTTYPLLKNALGPGVTLNGTPQEYTIGPAEGADPVTVSQVRGEVPGPFAPSGPRGWNLDGDDTVEFLASPASELAGNVRTIGVVFRVGASLSATEVLISRRGSTGISGWQVFIDSSNDKIRALTSKNSGGSYNNAQSLDAIMIGSWNFLQVTFTGGEITALSLNGVSGFDVLTPVNGTYGDSSESLRVGVDAGLLAYFTGDITQAWIKDGSGNTLFDTYEDVGTEVGDPIEILAEDYSVTLDDVDALGNPIVSPLLTGEFRPDGVDQYGVIPYGASLNEATTEATWGVWVNGAELQREGGIFKYMFHRWDWSNNRRCWFLGRNDGPANNGEMSLFLSADGGTFFSLTLSGIPQARTAVVIRFNAGTVEAWADGTPLTVTGTAPASIFGDSLVDCSVGLDFTGANPSDITTGQLAFYPVAVSDEEVQEITDFISNQMNP